MDLEEYLVSIFLNGIFVRAFGISAGDGRRFGMEGNAKALLARVPAAHPQAWTWRFTQIEHLVGRLLCRSTLHENGSAAENRSDQAKWILDVWRKRGGASRSHKSKIAVDCLVHILSNSPGASGTVNHLGGIFGVGKDLPILFSVGIVLGFQRR